MLKLLNGILSFRAGLTPEAQADFQRLALGQSPDVIYIGCADSRVDPRVFASTEPGDALVDRNAGAMIPDHVEKENETAAILELGLVRLAEPVSHIIICGHSECTAMLDLFSGKPVADAPHYTHWLRHGRSAREKYAGGLRMNLDCADHNQLSLINVVEQRDRLKGHPLVRKRLETGALQLHGWWFEIATATVFAYDEASRRFVPIDADYVRRIAEMSGQKAL